MMQETMDVRDGARSWTILAAGAHALNVDRLPADTVVSGTVGETMEAFQAFAAAMSHHGLAAQPMRMWRDPLYAHEQIALAHTTADAALRHLAVGMFHLLVDRPSPLDPALSG